jgi:lysophospholipase L1-like esterase
MKPLSYVALASSLALSGACSSSTGSDHAGSGQTSGSGQGSSSAQGSGGAQGTSGAQSSSSSQGPGSAQGTSGANGSGSSSGGTEGAGNGQGSSGAQSAGGSSSSGGVQSSGATDAGVGSGSPEGAGVGDAGARTSSDGGACPALGTPPMPSTTTKQMCEPDGGAIACHFGGNPGNYDVSFVLGGAAAGKTVVQAERLREMLAEVDTAAGQTATYSMSINVRQPEGQPDWPMAADGTPGLDMYFNGPSPELTSIAFAPAAATDVVMYIATDSTGCDQDGPTTAGWGQWLPQFFGYGLSVANYGNSGALTECSAATTPCQTDAPYYSFYDNPKMWPAIKPLLKPGDVVLIEFAHNDKVTPKAQYEANLNTYISETRAAGAIPVLATPIPRNNWTSATMMSSNQLVNSAGVDLPASIRSVGAAAHVPVIDILAETLAAFSAAGEAKAAAYYADPTTHLSTVGANIVAGLIKAEIVKLNIEPLVCYLR